MLKLTRQYHNQIMFLVVVAISLLAARPILVPRLPQSTDMLFHFYTLIQLDTLIRQGIFYTRWFPYQASGFGLPLFHYYPPLAFYVAQGFSLFGLELLTALRLALGLTLVGGALGMYLWVQDVLNQAGPALVAATAYVCGPYMLYNAFFRGGFAEQFALMLMPLVLWAFHRSATTGQSRYLAAGAMAYAALILAHSLTAFIFSPALLLYLIILAKADNLAGFKPYRYPLLISWGGMGLGLGLAAFFWLPALAERHAISDLLSLSPDLDYRRNFIPFSALFTVPFSSTIRPALSLVAVGLAAIGLLDFRSQTSKLQRHSLFAGLAVGANMMMALPLSAGLWHALPFLRFFQFPHHFLGVALVFVSFLAGAGLYSLQRRLDDRHSAWPQPQLANFSFALWLSPPIILLIIGLLLSPAWGLTQVRYYPPLPAINVNFIMQKERESGQIGTLYIANFVPAAVKTMPPFALLARDGAERLDVDSLPPEAALTAANYNPLRYELTLSSPKPFVTRFNTFYFPGWLAQLDGQTVPITPTDPHGLISVAVPAGQHHLVVWFGSTPLRTLANSLTISSILILGFVTIIYHFKTIRRKTDD